MHGMSLASLIRLLALAALWGGSFMRVAVSHLGPCPRPWGGAVFHAGPGATLAIMGYRPRLGRYLWPLLALGVINSGIPFLMYALAARCCHRAIAPSSMPPHRWYGGGCLDVCRRHYPGARDGGAAGYLWCGGAGAGRATGDQHGGTGRYGSLFVATVCYAFSSYLTLRLAGANASVDTRAAVFISQLGALMVLTPALLLDMALEPGMLARLQAAPLLAWGNVAVLGLLSTALAYVLYFRLIADEGPQKALTVTFIVPVFAVLWGWALLDESLTVAHAMGAG